jgi:hypothetical protein
MCPEPAPATTGACNLQAHLETKHRLAAKQVFYKQKVVNSAATRCGFSAIGHQLFFPVDLVIFSKVLQWMN